MQEFSGALVVDIIAAVLAIVTMHDARIGIAMMLAVNLAAGALILPLRLSCFFAALATLGVIGHSVLEAQAQGGMDRELLESSLFGLAYFASRILLLARTMR